jgi:hypothetical protein
MLRLACTTAQSFDSFASMSVSKPSGMVIAVFGMTAETCVATGAAIGFDFRSRRKTFRPCVQSLRALTFDSGSATFAKGADLLFGAAAALFATGGGEVIDVDARSVLGITSAIVVEGEASTSSAKSIVSLIRSSIR